MSSDAVRDAENDLARIDYETGLGSVDSRLVKLAGNERFGTAMI
jgi:hypothetical protein